MDILESKMEVVKIPFSKLLKLELPSLAKEVIAIVEKHDPETLQIVEVFNLLLAQEANIAKLNARYGVHPLTLKLKPLREQLMLYVSALRVQLKVASKMNTQEILEAAVVMQLAFDTHLGKLRLSKNEKIIHEKIEEFIDEINRNLELQTASSTLEVMNLIDNLKSAQKVVKEFLLERKALISLRPKEKTKLTARSLTSALKDLFKQIEVAQLKHTELDYQPLFDELNDTLNVFRNLVTIRETYNKRKADERNGIETDGTIKQPEESTGNDGTPVSDETPEENGEMVEPKVYRAFIEGKLRPEVEEESSSNGSDEKNDKSLDKKKTAASSAKLSQPSVEKDDDENA